MGSINKQVSRYEATAVYTHPDAKVDIILVHGLNGDPQKTWTSKNGVYWPADLLPTSLREARANILVYGYNADVYSKKHGSSPSDNFIYMHAQTLITSLTHYRKDEQSSRNPIIWVCHSLGGILVKRALLYSNDLRTSQHEDYRSIYVSTYGLVFLGTPHTGSDLAQWGTVLQAMSDAVVLKPFFYSFHSESVLLKTLKRDNETLQNINNHFLDIYQRFKILMAHENHKTDLKGTRTLIVDAQSAGPQLPGVTYYSIEATHSGMCKFESKNAPGYRTVSTAIREWVLDAPDVIATRWRVEEDEKLARAKHEIEERMKPWLQSQPPHSLSQGSIPQLDNETTLPPSQEPSRIENNSSRPLLPEPETPDTPQAEMEFPSQPSESDHDSSREPIFVKPTVFRPNTYFTGREEEMKHLHKMLRDRKRRSVGTSSVLIQSMPGGGKSHLARQYVFQHKYDYPGGIFWIRAKSIQELDYGYWDIAKTAGLGAVRGLDQSGMNDTRRMVKAVQAWLSNNADWLLVLDGIHFDLPDLQHYIPFAKDTSIIYTSTERTPGEDYQFDNPQVLILDPLTKREAQELLFEEMGKQQPWTQDDLRRAEELVELMDRLPLMIHVSALQLKATREPLAKYLRSYRSRPKAGKLPAYRAVREQLEHRGASAALNLMSVLAFFGTHVPVEMIVLGAKVLDKRTPVKSFDAETRRASLNNTFQILIAFALLERNENNEASSASSRSTRSVDMGQDNLDILRIHGIVQAFFVDVLAEERQVAFWLERATCVFCKAFDASNRRVDDDAQTGVPEDFRRFLIHGQRLLSHLDRFEKRYSELAACRELLESRLETIQGRVDELIQRATAATIQGSGDMIVSVFERTNSLSEGDSETPPSNSSLLEVYMIDEGTDPLESPSVYGPSDYNPYHWHVTYPYGPPYHAEDDLEYSRTVTPQPAPTEIFESISMPDDDETTRKVFGPHHRTIKRHSERRYRDHAGSWRAAPQIVSDPRVSISRETAKGVIGSSAVRQGGGPHLFGEVGTTLGSEAELTLNQIKKGAPSLPKGETVLADTSSTVNIRPKLMAGQPSYANPYTEEATGDDYPVSPTFSIPAPSSRNAAATIMRLKENTGSPVSTEGLAPVKVSSPLAAAPLNTTSLSTSPPSTRRLSAVGGEMPDQMTRAQSRSPSGPPSGPSSRPPSRPPSVPLPRTARSSPRSSPHQSAGPFRPPPIPIEVNSTISLRSPPSPNSRYFDSHPRNRSYAIDEDDEYQHPMAHSLPTIRPQPYPNPPYPHTVHMPPGGFNPPDHPPPWVASATSPNLHPQGYSSQPMSRDPSGQGSSNQSHGSTRSQPFLHSDSNEYASGGYGSGSSPLITRHSSPASQIMQRPRSRRPSVVETEPSPRLEGFELDPGLTSYRLYNESAARGRKRGGSASVAGTPYPSGANPGSSSSGFLRRLRSKGKDKGRSESGEGSTSGSGGVNASNKESRRHRRTESAGGRLSFGSFRARGGNNRSPDLRPVSPMTAAAAGMEAGAEDMARSASGGIRLADGSVVEFGSPPLPGEGSNAVLERNGKGKDKGKGRKSGSMSPRLRFGIGSGVGRRTSGENGRRDSGSGSGVVGLGIQ